jgi:hypothetical protein
LKILDILGLGNRKDVEPYETLTYVTGPGHMMHTVNGTLRPITNFTEQERSAKNYMHISMIGLDDAGHAGEDVGVFARGKGSNLIQGGFEQSYIPYVVSFSSCIGPAKHLNPECNEKYRYQTVSSGSSSLLNVFTMIPMIVSTILYFF